MLELLEENGLQDKVRVVRMGIPDRLITHGDAKLLLAKYGLDADGIYNRVKESIEVLDDRRAKSRRDKRHKGVVHNTTRRFHARILWVGTFPHLVEKQFAQKSLQPHQLIYEAS